MKMHVLIVGLAVLYWAVMTAAQTAFTAAEPCPAAAAAPLAAVEPEPMIDADDADRIVADRIYRLAALSEEEAAAAEPKCGR
jgi:hypothetical protein